MSQLNLIGTTLGRFEIISELGRGGMAVVYKARQSDLDRIVAIKILPPEMTHDTNYVARFRHEARSAARLEHPHIMPVYEVGEIDGLHYIAMKYIQGRTLKDLVQEDGALSVRRAAEILSQIGDALDHAHRQGIIHRDIKPSNIMITDEGWGYLTDFGLARGTDGATSGLTMAGTVMGTPEYMSPEQAQGLASVGPPTDIYALGVVLYELLTDTFPFHAETPMAMLAARLLQAPIPPRDVRGDLPPAVEDVVMRSLARKPEARFASAAEMVSALRVAAGIGAAPQAQPPLTPVGGVPAIGETMVVTPSLTPPYVRPQVPTPPLQAYVGPTQAVLQRGTPALGLPPPPSLPATPTPQLAPGAKPKIGLFIGMGVAALVLVIAVVGVLAFVGRPPVDPGPPVVSAPIDSALTKLLQQGDKNLIDGNIDRAFDLYQQVLNTSPDNTAALSGVAIIDNMRADWQKAEESANTLVNASSSVDTNKAAALGLALLADAISSQGRAAEAAEQIKQALSLDSGLALAHAINSNMMAIQALSANNTAGMDKALREADKAVDSRPDETLPILALTYHAIGFTFAQDYRLSRSKDSLAEGKADYQKAIELQPNLPLFHTNLGYLLNSADDYGEARAAFQRALDLDDTNEAAHNGMAWSLVNSGKYPDAEKEFSRAIELAPDYANAHYGLGLTLEYLNRKDEARAAYTKALELDPLYTDAQTALDRIGK